MKRKLFFNLNMCLALCCLLALPIRSLKAQIITIGTGTSYSNFYNPASNYGSTASKNMRWQIIYTVADLKAAGINGAQFLDSIAWNVQRVANFPLPNYTIKMKNVQDSSMLLKQPDVQSLMQVSLTPSFLPVVGWNWLRFQTPFYWNGYDNLLINVCWDTLTSYATSSTANYIYYTSSTNKVIYNTTGKDTICNRTTSAESHSNRPNIQMSFRAAPACSGTPTVGVSPTGPIVVCPGAPSLLTGINMPSSSGITYQWQQSANGNTWNDVTNATNPKLNVVAVNSIQYRLKVTCGASSQSATSNTVVINTSPVTYASIPYDQDFESWMTRCDTLELPGENWTAYPIHGKATWRREDQGAKAGWTEDIMPNSYAPVSTVGSHSARMQSSKGPAVSNISLHLNCSGTPAGKEIRFDYLNKTGSANFLNVQLSTDGGATFTSLIILNNQGVSGTWQAQVVPFSSTSATTIIKFEATSVGLQVGDFDMGIDNLHILAPCDGTPIAGKVDSNGACKGSGVKLHLTGNTYAAGMAYVWQQSTDGIAWVDVLNGNIESPTTPLNQDTWYRCVVTCTNTNKSDTTDPRLLRLNSFYTCYCASSSTVANPYVNIGNVKILTQPASDTLLNNGNPLPATNNLAAKQHYSNFASLGAANVYRDSTYKVNLTFFTHAGTNSNPTMWESYNKIYIDYNRNGSFEDNEMIWVHKRAANVYYDSVTFQVPDTASIGITGLRIVASNIYDSTKVLACGPYSYGETEDYLINISKAPCTANAATGTVAASDTLLCPGYPFLLANKGYDTTSGGLTTTWQISANGTSWTDVANTTNTHSLKQQYAATSWYRIKSTCGISKTDAYSNTVKVDNRKLCYCASYADGGFAGAADSSDVGGFVFGIYEVPLTGSHLNNPDAKYPYTSYDTMGVFNLYVDSAYEFNIDHTLLRTQGNAKVTMFIDYNANGVYDVPAERVHSGIARVNSWHQMGTITIPTSAVMNKSIGMRVIINNDTTANVPSDEACGTYISGETEDYTIQFLKKPVGIENLGSTASYIHIFPNPTSGLVAIKYYGAAVGDATVQVQNIAGQVIKTQTFGNIKNGSVMSINLGGYAQGVYLINVNAAGVNVINKVVVQ